MTAPSKQTTTSPPLEETLDQLVARLPALDRRRTAIPAIELGEFRFPNGDTLVAYVGGVKKRDPGDQSTPPGDYFIHYSPCTRTVRGKQFLGLKRSLNGTSDYTLNCGSSLRVPTPDNSGFIGITETDKIIERRERHLSSLTYRKISDLDQEC